MGQHLVKGLQALAADMPETFSNPRGLGLMCAIDLPDGQIRDKVADKAYDLGLMILGCGPRSLRFRSPLDVQPAEIDEALGILQKAADEI